MENVNIEKIFHEHQNITSSMLKHSSAAVAIINTEGIIKYETETIEHILGFTSEDMLGTSIIEWAHPSDRSMLRQKISYCAQLKEVDQHAEFLVWHKDGSWRNAEMYMFNMFSNPSIDGILVHLRDRTEYEKIRQRAFFFQFNDSITGLPKRELFVSRLEREINRAGNRENRIAVMSLGINRFRYINDKYGSTCGYRILKKIGQSLQYTFREDDLVCRFEGPVFMVLLTDIGDSHNARHIFKKTEIVLREPVLIEGSSVRVSAGMGICFYPQDGIDADTLIKNSMAAMDNAMNLGRTAYALFDEKQNKEMIKRIEIGNEMQNALENDEFLVHYQPKVDNSEMIVGMEALVRWYSPKRGLVYPATFIPIAEGNGIIGDISRIVLLRTCMQLKRWHADEGCVIPTAVNISAKELNNGDIAADFEDVLREINIDPQWLEVEITESALMENEKEGIRKLTEIHNMGVRVAIDDFGTGYSSLSRLKNYPIDGLKIDKSFVNSVPQDQRSSTLVKTMITLGHDLGLQVVAEGVETQAQFDFLKGGGCDQYQGYFFYRPAEASYFKNLVINKA